MGPLFPNDRMSPKSNGQPDMILTQPVLQPSLEAGFGVERYGEVQLKRQRAAAGES